MRNDYLARKETSKPQSSTEDDGSDNSITLYYKAFACNRPEPGESNAESAEICPHRKQATGIETEKKTQASLAFSYQNLHPVFIKPSIQQHHQQ